MATAKRRPGRLLAVAAATLIALLPIVGTGPASAATGDTTIAPVNLGLAGSAGDAADFGAPFLVYEFWQGPGGTDLNGDGDTTDSVIHVWDAATGAITNLGLAGGVMRSAEFGFAFRVDENQQGGTDLNGDGDATDSVIHVWDAAIGTVTNLGRGGNPGMSARWGHVFAVYEVSSAPTGVDLNGDGDTSDSVIHVWDAATGAVTNLGLATQVGGAPPVATATALLFAVDESDQGASALNGDGDSTDQVFHVWDAATGAVTNLGLAGDSPSGAAFGFAFSVGESAQGVTDLNGDGDTSDKVLHRWDAATGAITNLGRAIAPGTSAADSGVAFRVRESAEGVGGTDWNGDGDTIDDVSHLWNAATATITNLRLAGTGPVAAAFGCVRVVDEFAQNHTDLNGDGDATDQVVHVCTSATGAITNLGLAGSYDASTDLGFGFRVFEPTQTAAGIDLNGDGDSSDEVLHLWDATNGTVTNLGLATFGAAGAAFGYTTAVREDRQGNSDLNGDGDTGDWVVHAITINHAPTANPDAYAVPAGETLTVNGVLGNDTDPNGDPLTAVASTQPGHGTLSLAGDGSFNYQPTAGFAGVDSFTYVANDGGLDSSPATVSITVGNAPPVANPEAYVVTVDTTLTGNVLGNDTDPNGDPLTAALATGPSHGTLTLAADGSFTYRTTPGFTGTDSFTYVANDGEVDSTPATVTITVALTPPHDTGLVDQATGRWYLREPATGATTTITFGNPGDLPFVGDWDCDGVETPGLYRPSDGYVYLRNSNTTGIADVEFFFGNPGDQPIAGDFNGDGCDTVSIYRPSEQRFYIVNRLGSGAAGLGAADTSYVFGNPGDEPFVGDFNGDGVETAGLRRAATGSVHLRNVHTQGVADDTFAFGDPADRILAGDWNGDGAFSIAVFRPGTATFYQRFTNTEGAADLTFPFGASSWLPIAGHMLP